MLFAPGLILCTICVPPGVVVDLVYVVSTFDDARSLVRDGWTPSVASGGLFEVSCSALVQDGPTKDITVEPHCSKKMHLTLPREWEPVVGGALPPWLISLHHLDTQRSIAITS